MSSDQNDVAPPAGGSADDRSEVLERATELAFDVANRGVKAIVDYMERGGDLGTSAASKDAQRVGELAVRSLGQATKVAQDEGTDSELKSVERSLLDLADAAGPKLALAVARLVTRNPEFADLGPRDNTILVLRELGRMATSLLDESVGNLSPSRPASDRGPQDVLRATCAGQSTGPVEVELHLRNEASSVATLDNLHCVVTPLVGARHVLTHAELKLPEEIAAFATTPATLVLADNGAQSDVYEGSVYVFINDQLVASTGVEVTVEPVIEPAAVVMAVADPVVIPDVPSSP